MAGLTFWGWYLNMWNLANRGGNCCAMRATIIPQNETASGERSRVLKGKGHHAGVFYQSER